MKHRRWIRSVWGAVALAGAAALPQANAGSEDLNVMGTVSREPMTDRVIVKYRELSATAGLSGLSGLSAKPDAIQMRNLDQAAAIMGGRFTHVRRTGQNAHVLKLERAVGVSEMNRIVQQIKRDDSTVDYAEPDRILKPLLTPNDTRYGEQWHYFEAAGGINLPPAWDKSTGAGVIVAVIDTGYRPHADLAANIVGGYDFINDTAVSVDGDGRDADAQDAGDWFTNSECGPPPAPAQSNSSWHGTHVAGTIAAVTNNGVGVAGVAFGAKVLPVRALGKCGGYTSDIADGIVWASGGSVPGVPANANVAKVINMSLGGGGACDTTTQNAINSARSRGTVVVVAAGNENQNAANVSPASCSGVITVAAVARNGGRASYSNFGSLVAVAAPGGGTGGSVLSTLNGGARTPGADSYAGYQGTSMATPHVAGVVALMLSKNPALTPDDVKTKLQQTARAFPATCSQCGAGIIDASAAVDAAGGATTPPPTGGGTIAEVESNNTLNSAQSIGSSGTTVNGTISASSDTDYYKVTLPAGATLSATLTPNGSSDYDLYLYNSGGTLLARSEKGSGQVDSASVTNSGAAASYYARVRYYSGSTGSGGTYSIKLSW